LGTGPVWAKAGVTPATSTIANNEATTANLVTYLISFSLPKYKLIILLILGTNLPHLQQKTTGTLRVGPGTLTLLRRVAITSSDQLCYVCITPFQQVLREVEDASIWLCSKFRARSTGLASWFRSVGMVDAC
jgi:hypothetical protein